MANDLVVGVGADLTDLQSKLDKARADIQTFARGTTGDVKLGLFGNTPDFMKGMQEAQTANLKIRDSFVKSLDDTSGLFHQRGRKSGEEFRRGLEQAVRGMEGARLVEQSLVAPMKAGMTQTTRQAHFMIQDIAVVLGQGGQNVWGRAMMAASNNIGMLGMASGGAMAAATGLSVVLGGIVPWLFRIGEGGNVAATGMNKFRDAAKDVGNALQELIDKQKAGRDFQADLLGAKDHRDVDRLMKGARGQADDAAAIREIVKQGMPELPAGSGLTKDMLLGMRPEDVENLNKIRAEQAASLRERRGQLMPGTRLRTNLTDEEKVEIGNIDRRLKELNPLPDSFIKAASEFVAKFQEANEKLADAEAKVAKVREAEQKINENVLKRGPKGLDRVFEIKNEIARDEEMGDLLQKRRQLANALANRDRPTLRTIRDDFENPAVARGSQQDIAAVASQRAKEQASVEKAMDAKLGRLVDEAVDMRQTLRNVERELRDKFGIVDVRP